ncbi:MAG: AraC family transcriptional regulator, partial [Phycisphaerae bacterium]|nr:AraC family transcriptional regulator [Saprospiraceae bacterium]
GAETIFSGNVRLILEQLQNAGSYNQMITIADQFVTSLVNKKRKEAHQLDAVSRLMIRSGGNASLDWLANQSYLSSKQFKRKFYERTGVNPKTYLRIIRFNKAFNTRNAYPDWDWLRIALECDYYDYQHLVRDYKEFTKQTPNEFHRIESNSPERRLGLTAEIYKSRAASAVFMA